MRRTLLLIVVTGLVALAAGAKAGGDGERIPKSSAVKRALEKRDRAVEQADAAYRKAVGEANKALLVELKKAKEAAFATKDENEVIAVSALVAKTEQQVKASARARASEVVPAGAWWVHWAGGNPFRYEFSTDGSDVTDGRFKTVRMQDDGGARTYWIDGPDGAHVHRYRSVDQFLFVEAWIDTAAFERGDACVYLGVARRAE